MLERYWGAGTIKMAGQTYVELTSFHKYIKNASPCGTVLTGNPEPQQRTSDFWKGEKSLHVTRLGKRKPQSEKSLQRPLTGREVGQDGVVLQCLWGESHSRSVSGTWTEAHTSGGSPAPPVWVLRLPSVGRSWSWGSGGKAWWEQGWRCGQPAAPQNLLSPHSLSATGTFSRAACTRRRLRGRQHPLQGEQQASTLTGPHPRNLNPTRGTPTKTALEDTGGDFFLLTS